MNNTTPNKVYNIYKGKKIKQDDYTGYVCGYGLGRYILATESHPNACFRRLDKDSYVDDEYKDKKYQYVYCDEATFLKQYPHLDAIKGYTPNKSAL